MKKTSLIIYRRRKMKTSKIKTISAAIALVLTTAIALSLLAVPIVHAQHDPPWNITVYAYINAAPNPVGAGQKVDILIWVDKVRRSATLDNEYRIHNFRLTIKDAGGTVVLTQFWETVIDTTSSQYYAWTPTVAGQYTLIFDFEGFDASDYPSDVRESTDIYLPDSDTTTVTVLEEPLPPPVTSYPLPQEYWTRPIYGENTDWWSISSNWLGTGSPNLSSYSFSGAAMKRESGDAIGSKTAHIMWTKPLQMGGVAGGTVNTPILGNTWFEGSAYNQRYANPIIVAGRLYYNPPISFTGSNSGPTTCVDLRTGEVIWSRNDVSGISFAYIYDVENPQQHGVYPALLASSNFGRIYDAETGELQANVTGVPSGTAVLGSQGEHLRYVIANAGSSSNPDYRLAEWNSSLLWTGRGWANPTSSGLSPAWDTQGEDSVDASISTGSHTRYDWNVSIPWRNGMSPSPSAVDAIYNDIMIMRNGSLPSLDTRTGSSVQTPYTYFAVSLKPQSRGQVLWWKTYNPPPGNVTVGAGSFDPVNRIFMEVYKETRQFVGYSMDTGDRLWTTESQVPLDYYGNPAFPYVASQAAYGKLYSVAYGGILYCYDTLTGDLLWTYGNGGEGNSTNSGFYLAYGHYPTFIGAVGDGIVYTFTAEHTVNTPLYKGALVRAINATDGTEIWTLSNYDGSFFAISYAMADGYNTFFNGYDNQIYVVGKGPSATTVSAPDVAAPFGAPIVIKGTVTDISAGTKQNEQAARFPAGVPAISDESMPDWMEYIYQQRPLPTDAVGITVTLSVFDSNNNYREIGTATTDTFGFYNFEYTPEIPGKYVVYAIFEGTEGYWPSKAVTAFTVMQAEPEPPAPPADQPSIADQYFLPMSIGIIVAIVVVGALVVLLLRKR